MSKQIIVETNLTSEEILKLKYKMILNNPISGVMAVITVYCILSYLRMFIRFGFSTDLLISEFYSNTEITFAAISFLTMVLILFFYTYNKHKNEFANTTNKKIWYHFLT